jgi:hypothetical protein
MFSPRLGTVFASRWKALWWAAGILVTAYCTIPAADDGPAPGAASSPGPAAAPTRPSRDEIESALRQFQHPEDGPPG